MVVSTKQRLLVVLALILFLVVICLVLPSACSCRSQVINTPHAGSFFSAIDTQILTSAYTEYHTLRQTCAPPEARKQLLTKISSQKGVREAHLGVDGYTIFVNYTDGDRAGVYTFEPEQDAEQISHFGAPFNGRLSSLSLLSKNGRSNRSLAVPITYDSLEQAFDPQLVPNLLNATAVGGKITPKSKKVLILGWNYWEWMKTLGNTLGCIQLLKDHGWTDADITAKLVINAETDFGNIKPEDYFNLQEYGIILFIGHGGAADHNFGEDNAYLQFCYLETPDDWARMPELEKWKNEGKILITGLYSHGLVTMIRADLLREKMGILPCSYVFLGSCYGGYLGPAFLSNQAGAFLGWKSIAIAQISDPNMENMLKMMLEKNASAQNAFSAIKSSYSNSPPDNTDVEGLLRGLVPAFPRPPSTYNPDPNRTFTLATDPNVIGVSTQFYLPCWFDLDVSRIPGNATQLKIIMLDPYDNTIESSVKINTGDVQTVIKDVGGVFFPPDTYRCDVFAYDSSGGRLATGSQFTVLKPGQNNIAVSLRKYAYTLTGSADASTGIKCTNGWSNAEVQVWLNGINYHYMADFDAVSGDVLEIKLLWKGLEPEDGGSVTLGPIWLYSWEDGKAIKIAGDGSYSDLPFNKQNLVLGQWKYTFPGAKPSPTPTPTPSTSPAAPPSSSITPSPSPSGSATPTGLPTKSPTTTPTTVSPTITSSGPRELSYDDGKAEEWLSLGGKDKNGFLVRFTPGTPFTLNKVRIYNLIRTTPDPSSQFTLQITDKNLVRRWSASFPFTLFTAKASWLDISVPNMLMDGEFCVELLAPTMGPDLGPFVGVDESGINTHSDIISNFQLGQWIAPMPKETANWMIRVVGN
jgi:hypothetical protein